MSNLQKLKKWDQFILLYSFSQFYITHLFKLRKLKEIVAIGVTKMQQKFAISDLLLL